MYHDVGSYSQISYRVDIEEYYEVKCALEKIVDQVESETDRFMARIELMCRNSDVIVGDFAENVATMNDTVRALLSGQLEEATKSMADNIAGYNNSSFNYRIAESDHLEG